MHCSSEGSLLCRGTGGLAVEGECDALRSAVGCASFGCRGTDVNEYFTELQVSSLVSSLGRRSPEMSRHGALERRRDGGELCPVETAGCTRTGSWSSRRTSASGGPARLVSISIRRRRARRVRSLVALRQTLFWSRYASGADLNGRLLSCLDAMARAAPGLFLGVSLAAPAPQSASVLLE